MQMHPLLRPRKFASICSTGGGGRKKGIAERGIEISDSNLNSAFERQPCSAGETAGGRYSLRRLAQEDGRKMGPLSPLEKSIQTRSTST